MKGRLGRRVGMRAVVMLGAVVLGAVVLGGCSGHAAAGHPEISVSAPVALADQAVTIRITGLAPGQRVTVTAQATDDTGLTWQADATFTAGQDGLVDRASAAPDSGSYQGADGMGLLWSLGLPGQANVGGNGEFAATPPPGTPRHPGVLLFGGAEGGMSQVYAAALLAAHGYPALTVAYFDWPGLPGQLERIPLEYFETAGRILAAQPGTEPAHVLALGYSEGSEAALLAADYFPQVFHGAIVYSPSSFASPAQDDASQPAWTLNGKGIAPGPIPEYDISGPVLALAAGDDALVTDAGESADEIAFDLESEGGKRYPGQALVYPDAGHAVGTFPYQPITSAALGTLGGTRAGDVAAQRAGWAAVLSLLARLS